MKKKKEKKDKDLKEFKNCCWILTFHTFDYRYIVLIYSRKSEREREKKLQY